MFIFRFILVTWPSAPPPGGGWTAGSCPGTSAYSAGSPHAPTNNKLSYLFIKKYINIDHDLVPKFNTVGELMSFSFTFLTLNTNIFSIRNVKVFYIQGI
jgi:hypothetical protein